MAKSIKQLEKELKTAKSNYSGANVAGASNDYMMDCLAAINRAQTALDKAYSEQD